MISRRSLLAGLASCGALPHAAAADMPSLLALLAARRRERFEKQLTFLDSHEDTSNASSYTWSSPPWGVADPNRWMILTGGTTGNTPEANAITIGGASTTLVLEHVNGAAMSFIAMAHLPADPGGGDDDAEVVLETSVSRFGMAMWHALLPPGFDPLTDIVDTKTSVDINPSVMLATVNGGFIVAHLNHQSETAVAWNITKRYGEDIESGAVHHSGADTATDGSSKTVSVTNSGSPTNRTMVAVSF